MSDSTGIPYSNPWAPQGIPSPSGVLDEASSATTASPRDSFVEGDPHAIVATAHITKGRPTALYDDMNQQSVATGAPTRP